MYIIYVRQTISRIISEINNIFLLCMYIYRLLMYGRKIKPAACKHRIFCRVVHVQVLDGVRGAHPRRGDEESDAQTVIYL